MWTGGGVGPAWLGNAWRHVAVAGAAAGLALSPVANMAPGLGRGALAVSVVLVLVLALARPGGGESARGLPGRPTARAAGSVWLGVLALCCALAGLAAGTLRLDAIDAGAYRGEAGGAVDLRGFVTAVPRRADGEVSVRLETADGRLLVVSPEPVAELPVGREVEVRGSLRPPRDWERDYLERLGIATVVGADRIDLTGRRRGGLAALGDRVRDRAEAALERGTPPAEAALLRGFVLGQDDLIDPQTVDDFQRSGLAHLLAVSGQNVLLLALLAMPILALLGVGLRARFACVLILIAIYVPVAGAGPSIQRAGIMGAAAVVAALASRPASRWHAMLLAAAVTLAMDPRASADVGWQLSFAAVAGIAVWASGLGLVLGGSRPAAGPAVPAGPVNGLRAALADAVAVTVAATAATAPLMAHHFEAVSLAALPANLLALPAVAPVMWLGMLSAAAGQLSFIPVEPLTSIAGLLAAYIAQVAHWLAAPGWAQVEVRLDDPLALGAAYALLAAGLGALIASGRRRVGMRGRGPRIGPWSLARRAAIPAVGLAAALAAATVALGPTLAGETADTRGLRITVLDVGQGDAILLDPPGGDAMLVDGGPPGEELVERLRALGVERLGATILTHPQLDHLAGIEDVLGRLPVERFVFARAGRRLIGDARTAGAQPTRSTAGAQVRSGDLRLRALWPPQPLLAGAEGDPNRLSLVLLARWHGFRMLLTGDAEAESVPLDPGSVDVLKVAHHGSDDAGLDQLLDRTVPRLAVISVGDANPYGHPAPATLATLSDHEVPALRTDLDGEITIAVDDEGWTAATAE